MPQKIDRFFELALMAAALGFVALFVAVATLHMGYPFELEWMEGGMLEHVRRILMGERLYLEPSLQFVPFIYSPLYFYLSAMVSLFCGGGFAALRALSLLAALCCFVSIYAMIRQRTERQLPAFLGAALFLATYSASGAWLDLARVDSLFLAFVLLSIQVSNLSRKWENWLLAGVLAALAFHTKQVALITGAALAVQGFLLNRRAGLAFSGAFVVVAGGGAWLLDMVHDGWYSYYVFYLPAAHDLKLEYALPIVRDGILYAMPVAALVAFAAFREGEVRLALGLPALGLVAVSFSSALHSGSYANSLMPTHAIIAVLFGVTVSGVMDRARSSGAFRPVFHALCLAQLALLAYDPADYLPRDEDREAGWSLVRKIAEHRGPVLVPRHGYLAALADKPAFAHEMAMNDVLKGDKKGGGQKLFGEIGKALSSKRFGAIIVDYDWLKPDVEMFYKKKEPAFNDKNVFWPVTGNRTRPEVIYTVVEKH